MQATVSLCALILSDGFLCATEVDTEAILELSAEGLVDPDQDTTGEKYWLLTGHGWYRWNEIRSTLLGEDHEESERTKRHAMKTLAKLFTA